jgi:hypothetical protein
MQATNNTIYYKPYEELPIYGAVVNENTEEAKQIVIPQDIAEGHPGMYALGVTVTVIAVGLFVAANIVAFPFAGPIALLALGILAAVTYGIVNDQLACRQCIEYFTIGHTQSHQRLLKTDNPTLNGIVWGIHSTWILGTIAGTAMAVTALATGLVVAPILPYLALAFAVGIGLVCLYAHIQAKNMEAAWSLPEEKDNLNVWFDRQIIIPIDGYHPVQLEQIAEHKRAAYKAVGERNAIGYTTMPQLGGLTLISLIALSILL